MKIRKASRQLAIVWGACALLSAGNALRAQSSAAAASDSNNSDGQHDFDYLVGSWNIHLKRLLRPLTGSHEWIEFDGTVVCRHIWQGNGEIEEFNVDSAEKNGPHTRTGRPTIRPEIAPVEHLVGPSKQWCDGRGTSGSPFYNGRGEFYGQDALDGRPIFVRFQWTKTDHTVTPFRTVIFR